MQNRQISNNALHQIMLIIIIILISLLVFKNLTFYLPGFLGAITLYVLFRRIYFKLTDEKRLNKSMTSMLLIILSLIFIILPMWALIDYLYPQLMSFFTSTEAIIERFNTVKVYMSDKPILKEIDLSDEALVAMMSNVTKYIPSILNSVTEIVINIIVTFFVLYFMQVHSHRMENYVRDLLPFSANNKNLLWQEFFMMVRSNALGIPILGFVQGIVAVIGYAIFGVDNYVFWGMLTGAASIIPIAGTMVIWVPMVLILLSSGETASAIGLFLYSFIIVGGIDNVLRFTILKTLGNVPPLITVFGVLFGLNVFGMLGVIFGPLLISSIFVLIKVYQNEYGSNKNKIILSSSDIPPSTPLIVDSETKK